MATRISILNCATRKRTFSYYFLVVESLCSAIVTLFERLRWRTPGLMHTLGSQLRPYKIDS